MMLPTRPLVPTFCVDAAAAIQRLVEADPPHLDELLEGLPTSGDELLLNHGNTHNITARLQALAVRNGWVSPLIYPYFNLNDLVDCAIHGGPPWDLVVHERTFAESGVIHSNIGAPLGLKVLVIHSPLPLGELLQ